MKDPPYEYDINKLFNNFDVPQEYPQSRRKDTLKQSKKPIDLSQLCYNEKAAIDPWSAYFDENKVKNMQDKAFQKKLENFLFIHLKESDHLVHETVESVKKEYFTL